jgi:hypothetical protein
MSLSGKQLLQLIDEAYDHKAWHGPNLKGSLRGVDVKTALWRPSARRHNIWEIALHAAYWKYAVRRRLLHEKRGSFAFKGSNWFARDRSWTLTAWSDDRRLLEEEHQRLRTVIADLDDEFLAHTLPGRKERFIHLLQGIACHDVYHAGQIQLLKRMAR